MTGTAEPRDALETVRLLTWQGSGFDICSGEARYDRRKARYYNDPDLPGAKEAYERLFRELGTDQFVWCYTREPCPPDKGTRRALRVPVACVLRFVDSLAWNRILGVQGVFPPALHR